MDLKIRDVAELLSVSETTIRRWLKDGKIPAYQLNHQYRFSRTEIEDWMMQCKLHVNEGPALVSEVPETLQAGRNPMAQHPGFQKFGLYRAMYNGGVIPDVSAHNKRSLIREAVRLFAPRLGLDPHVVTELLLERESLISTALNGGIAVPHPRELLSGLSGSDTVITLFPKEPVDYGALDGRPVHTLFFLFSTSDKTHLHLLSKLALLGSNKDVLEFLTTKPRQEMLLAYIKDWEGNIRVQHS